MKNTKAIDIIDFQRNDTSITVDFCYIGKKKVYSTEIDILKFAHHLETIDILVTFDHEEDYDYMFLGEIETMTETTEMEYTIDQFMVHETYGKWQLNMVSSSLQP